MVMTEQIARISGILDHLAERPLWRLGELAEAVDLPAATCARLLAGLVAEGWAGSDRATGCLSLGSTGAWPG